MTISLTKQETESQRMSPGRLKQAVEAIRQDGYVVIENAIRARICTPCRKR